MTVNPYTEGGSKRQQVEHMFDAISPKYDLLNRVFSMGVDQGWRRKVIRMVKERPTAHRPSVHPLPPRKQAAPAAFASAAGTGNAPGAARFCRDGTGGG